MKKRIWRHLWPPPGGPSSLPTKRLLLLTRWCIWIFILPFVLRSTKATMNSYQNQLNKFICRCRAGRGVCLVHLGNQFSSASWSRTMSPPWHQFPCLRSHPGFVMGRDQLVGSLFISFQSPVPNICTSHSFSISSSHALQVRLHFHILILLHPSTFHVRMSPFLDETSFCLVLKFVIILLTSSIRKYVGKMRYLENSLESNSSVLWCSIQVLAVYLKRDLYFPMSFLLILHHFGSWCSLKNWSFSKDQSLIQKFLKI